MIEIVNKAFVDKNAAYYNSGGIINGTQRMPTNHLIDYWQQDNAELNLSHDFKVEKSLIKVKSALYVGRIPVHFGHFLMEGLPRLCDTVNFNIPLIGMMPSLDETKPENKNKAEAIKWLLETITDEPFYKVVENQFYRIDKLYVPTVPLVLSQSCGEPWRMTKIIAKIVKKARKDNPDVKDNIKNLYLKRDGETIMYGSPELLGAEYSTSEDHISKQIAKVSYAIMLSGKTGSNTHLSLFARHNTMTNWTYRHDYLQTNRNQLICDFIKTFNKF
jgi:hypothetical protein